jgi:hypothetical protein
MTDAEPPPDPRRTGVFPTQDALRRHVNGWELSGQVAGGVAYILRVARSLLVDSYITYDYALPAVTWAMLGLERCLDGCVGAVQTGRPRGSTRFETLIAMAEQHGLIDGQEARVLHGVRRIRNDVVHGALFPTFPLDAAVEMLSSIHGAVSDIYDRASAWPAGSVDPG